MKPLKFFCVVVVLILIASFLYAEIVYDHEHTVTYDCGMAEWHPDIPNAVKEECRKIRAGKMI
jgi:hypothetical protein